MPKQIKIKAGHIEFEAELNDSITAKKVAEVLTIKVRANRWGGEIYSAISITADMTKDSREVFEPGELGFGSASGASSRRLESVCAFRSLSSFRLGIALQIIRRSR